MHFSVSTQLTASFTTTRTAPPHRRRITTRGLKRAHENASKASKKDRTSVAVKAPNLQGRCATRKPPIPAATTSGKRKRKVKCSACGGPHYKKTGCAASAAKSRPQPGADK
ncbi:hypothetical protein BX661DRAFT_169286 [Kickxella alabastrina]|uniref:uncharacterized protein n=1 Tax=Kickxella alabastrina TaxID=61397 RepID=UPI00221FAEC4|nr:uncharacterized protein BX661DRAFT_169286 [Kickxella alabastrina]KAI7833447.1 hypothetical protein BX661DRAFT_169286 [Kickxella alabastrina]